MSDHVKFYDYYIVEGPEVQALNRVLRADFTEAVELIKEAMAPLKP